MLCQNCGTPTEGTFCPACGTRVAGGHTAPTPPTMPIQQTQPYGSTAAPAPASQTAGPNRAVTILVSVLALAVLCAGAFFLVTRFSGGDDDTSPPTLPTQAAPTSSSTSSSSSSSSSSTSSQASSAPSSQSASSSTSSEDPEEKQALADLTSWAEQDLASITVSEDTYGARLSTKWVGITDEKNHPAPYTAKEIRDEFRVLQSRFGSDLKILPSDRVGQQNSTIKGHHGWIAVVMNGSINGVDSAKSWCKDTFGSDWVEECGEQHLNAAH